MLKFIFIVFFCSLALFTSAQQNKPMRGCALPGPTSTCSKIEANGDITLSWTQPTDQSNIFVRYEIYRIGTSGPIVTIPTFTSENHTTINSFFAKSKFYIGVVSLCNGIEEINFGDTINTINLSLNNQMDGRASLSWTSYTSNDSNYVHIEREHPKLGWIDRDSLSNTKTSYIDTIDICGGFLNYRIAMYQSGCVTYSNSIGDNFKDVIPPTIPTIKSISYDTLKKGISVNWYKNPARDVKGYLVKIGYDNSPLGFLDSVETKKHIEPLSYSLVNAPYTSAITFSISAYDSCLSSSPPNNQLSGNSEPHTGFNLKYTYSICQRALTLNWTKYIGWEDIKKYKIYYKIENGFWKLRDSTINQNYFDTLIGFKNYAYIVEAISSDNVKAFSNPIYFYSQSPSLPKYNYTKVATISNSLVKLEHLIEQVGGVSKIILEKKNKNGIFKELETKKVDNEIIEFYDAAVETNFETYSYRIRIIDSCGNKTTYGNEVTSMLLKIEKKQNDNENLNVNLSWTPYIGFNGSILNYAIYRKINGVYDPKPIAILPKHQLTYSDDILTLPDFNGHICYYVIAIESDNSYKQPSIANSNEVCTTFEPLIYVPNAFTPKGKNPVFHPVISMFEPLEYSLTIINRWGQPVFRSTDYVIGWDGNFGNELSPNGNYMYIIRFLDGDGKEYIHHGFVTLIN